MMIFFVFIYCMCTIYCFLLSCVLVYICSCLYIYIYMFTSTMYDCMLHDYPSSAWCMSCLVVWDSHAFPCFDLSYIYIYVFETFPYIFHFSCNFLIRLGCIIWLGMTISLYYGCSSIEQVIRSKI